MKDCRNLAKAKSPPCLKEGGPSQTVGGFNKTTESGNENLKKVKQFRQSVRNCFLYNENYAMVAWFSNG